MGLGLRSTLLAAALCVGTPTKLNTQAMQEPWHVNVCLLSDSRSPPSDSLIQAAFDTAAVVYKENANVILHPTPVISYTRSVDSLFTTYVTQVLPCPSETDITAIFTNGIIVQPLIYLSNDSLQNELSSMWSNKQVQYDSVAAVMRNPGNSILGWRLFFSQVVIVAAASSREQFSRFSPMMAPGQTLAHEIGHVFGEGHSEDEESFMYPSALESRGRWTARDKEGVASYLQHHQRLQN